MRLAFQICSAIALANLMVIVLVLNGYFIREIVMLPLIYLVIYIIVLMQMDIDKELQSSIKKE